MAIAKFADFTMIIIKVNLANETLLSRIQWNKKTVYHWGQIDGQCIDIPAAPETSGRNNKKITLTLSRHDIYCVELRQALT